MWTLETTTLKLYLGDGPWLWLEVISSHMILTADVSFFAMSAIFLFLCIWGK